jgi:hypothetical protein
MLHTRTTTEFDIAVQLIEDWFKTRDSTPYAGYIERGKDLGWQICDADINPGSKTFLLNSIIQKM